MISYLKLFNENPHIKTVCGVILGLTLKTLKVNLVLKPSTRVLEGTRNNLKITPNKAVLKMFYDLCLDETYTYYSPNSCVGAYCNLMAKRTKKSNLFMVKSVVRLLLHVKIHFRKNNQLF